ncbi:hypothetical protein MANES_08G114700v8 [Manihot esculenta]|uniref:Uncharacterized protein n=1 Tax=Manihot esculenta TaxID=3983 RepID=A0ACB7HCB9_MANES|nr:hypothetical protein MANES_08G114700v8 [Manihot esculenta]
MSATEPLMAGALPSDAALLQQSCSFRQFPELGWILDELPKATIVSVSRPDTGDISPMLLSYTIELQYKQFKWQLLKKASQVLYLHFSLKRRAIIEEFHDKQEQVKEWLHSLGIVDHHVAVVQDADEPDDGAVPLHQEESVRNRYVPSIAALPILRPALGGQQAISDRAKVAMQNYLNHFLGNLDIVNSREVCKFLEVSKLSFSREYGPKLKEGYLMVKHLSNISSNDANIRCCPCSLFDYCNNNWRKVWAVLKPGFLALLEDPFDTELLDIIVFDVLPISNGNRGSLVYLANQIKEHNPLRYSFNVSSGSQSIKFRTTSSGKVKQWITAINDAGSRPLEGWCHPHRFGSFAPPRGLTDDGSQAQWFVDGQAAFEAIAFAIENAKSEIFITGWWLCPELYLRRPFQCNSISRLDSLLEAKANQGVQIYILLYKEVAIALKINSLYSKNRLLNLHENVRVLRYPNHFSAGVYLWSHHEKLVIVDYQICFIGGLDLCFGRYDTTEHRVGDYPPHIWPGKDYYNPRESEPNSWEDTLKDELDRGKYPRMPWHDIHCALWGPACRDVARHFVQRWNHAKRSKAPNEQTIPLLMPHHHMVLPHYMGRSREIDIGNKKAEENEKDIARQDSFSLSPLQDVPLLLPQEAEALVLHSIDETLTTKGKNENLPDQPTGFCGSFSFSLQKSEVECLVPDAHVKDSVDALDSVDLQSNMSEEWSGTSEEDDHDVSAGECGQVGPRTACHCQNQFFISGLCGDDIIQNRVLDALYKRILQAHKEQKCFRVIIVLPLLPGFQGGIDDGGAATVRAIMHWQYRTISSEKTSILYHLNQLLGPKAHDYISFYGLRTYGRLFEAGPIATSQVYVHSKLMIVDDRVALIGSSNINDRSLLGSRDSEENTKIYQDVFACLPNDLIHSRGALRQSVNHWKEKLGHTTIDLGIAPEKLEFHENGETKVVDTMERLKSIKGHLVSFPLEFMCQEDLRPVFIESEFYASPHVFH